MSMNTVVLGIITLLAGVGIPTMAAMNASVGAKIGSPAFAASILCFVASMACLATYFVTSGFVLPDTLAPADLPKSYYSAGALCAFYILSVTYIAPRFGLGNAIMLVLMGQLISSTLIDQFGLFGGATFEITPKRAAALVLMAAGVILFQKPAITAQ